MKTTPSPSWCMFKQVLSFGIIEECRRWRPYPSYNHVPQCLVGLEGEIGQVEIATCAPNTFCVNRFMWRHNSAHKLSVTANRLPRQSVREKVTCKQNFADSPLILSSSMGPTFTIQWPSSMAAPLIFEKHSRRPHGSCVLWCCLRRTAPTRKTTWFAQGPRVIICGFCFLRYEDQHQLKWLDWIYPTPHKKGFFFSKYISYGLRKAV